jgi:hypothetical protein
MKYLALLLLLICAAHGFGLISLGSPPVRSSAGLFSATTETSPQVVSYFDDWVEAIDCASQFGTCDIETLEKLADKVRAGDGCTFETENTEACDQERVDRQRLAEMLHLQAQLRQQMDDLEVTNAFVRYVRDENNIRDRDVEMEILSEDAI